MSSEDKRRRARTQGRFSDPQHDKLRNKETNKRPSGHCDTRSLDVGVAQSGYENVHSTNINVNSMQEVKCKLFENGKDSSDQTQRYQLPKEMGLLDFQARNWRASQHPLDSSCLSNIGEKEEIDRDSNTEEKIVKSLEGSDIVNCSVKEVPLESNLEGDTVENTMFTKGFFTYEPTKLEEKVREKKTKRISESGWHTLSIEPSGISEIYFNHDFVNKTDQKPYFDYLNKYIKWELKEVVSYGTKYSQPRMVAWFGPFPYGYSGVVLKANSKFPEIVLQIKNKIERLLKSQGRTITFNSVLLNKYRDGKDGVAWHSDNELSMGVDPLIASISLGETRKFEMRKKQLKSEEPNESADIVVFLESGSLLIMDGVMQQDWLHRVPKEYHDKGVRINLTFRTVYPIDQKNIFQKSRR